MAIENQESINDLHQFLKGIDNSLHGKSWHQHPNLSNLREKISRILNCHKWEIIVNPMDAVKDVTKVLIVDHRYDVTFGCFYIPPIVIGDLRYIDFTSAQNLLPYLPEYLYGGLDLLDLTSLDGKILVVPQWTKTLYIDNLEPKKQGTVIVPESLKTLEVKSYHTLMEKWDNVTVAFRTSSSEDITPLVLDEQGIREVQIHSYQNMH